MKTIIYIIVILWLVLVLAAVVSSGTSPRSYQPATPMTDNLTQDMPPFRAWDLMTR